MPLHSIKGLFGSYPAQVSCCSCQGTQVSRVSSCSLRLHCFSITSARKAPPTLSTFKLIFQSHILWGVLSDFCRHSFWAYTAPNSCDDLCFWSLHPTCSSRQVISAKAWYTVGTFKMYIKFAEEALQSYFTLEETFVSQYCWSFLEF